MPFEALTDGAAITQLILQRQDRLETKMDALQAAQIAQSAQVMHALERMQAQQERMQTQAQRDDTPKIEIGNWTGITLVLAIAIGVIAVMFLIYSGGSFGG